MMLVVDNTELIRVEIVLKDLVQLGVMENARGARQQRHAYQNLTIVMVRYTAGLTLIQVDNLCNPVPGGRGGGKDIIRLFWAYLSRIVVFPNGFVSQSVSYTFFTDL